MIFEAERNTLHAEGLIERQEELCNMLFDGGRIQFGEFRLKMHRKYPDAPLSPVYLKLGELSDELQNKVGGVLADVEISGPPPDFCVGIPNAAIPIAQGYQEHSGIEAVEGLEKIADGNQTKVVTKEGFDSPARHAMLIDDVISGAQSKFEAIKALEDQGIVVGSILVLVDREQGGRQQLEARRYRLYSAMKLSQMLDFYLRTGKISQEIYEDTKARLKELNHFLKRGARN